MTRIEIVLIVHKPPKILLGLKSPKKKFGGKWNGFGGGLKERESLEDCAIRETLAETGIKVKDLKQLGEILFKFETDEPDHYVHFFKAENYKGTLDTSKDFKKYDWFHVNDLSKIYDQMMPADRYWLPYFVQDKMFKGEVHFNTEFGVAFHEINEINILD